MCLLLCMILYLVGVIQAAPTTNATTTSEDFVAPSFTNRTLWHIISSSVLTLFACIYSAIHPNIPSPKDSPFCILRRRLGIMIVALIAPELIVVWAMRQWFSARHVTKRFKDSGYFNVPQPQKQSENHELAELPAEQLEAPAEASTSRYGGTHAFVKPFKKLFQDYFSDQSEDYAWTQTHSFFVLMGGFMLYVDGEPYRTLEPDKVLELIRKGCVDAPTLTEKQICDRSKGNVISKGLIILQVAWFIMQLVSRAVYHLETTQLEAGTLAFAVLNFLTYALWWNKPLDVQCPYPVYWKSTESKPENHIRVVPENDDHRGSVLTATARAAFGPFFELMGASDILTYKLRVRTFDGSSINMDESNKWIPMFAGILMATIFGSIHCVAWFFAFPTYQEQVLWRISAVAITCTPWLDILLLAGTAINYVILSNVLGAIVLISPILYIAGRVILLVLMFTTLRNLPPDAYMVVSWISFVPHL